jgi:formiminotetrahydrofolate cyclodeaminase
VAVVTVGLMYMLYKFTSKRFELEAEEQKAIIERMDDLHDELLKLEGKVEAIANRANHE